MSLFQQSPRIYSIITEKYNEGIHFSSDATQAVRHPRLCRVVRCFLHAGLFSLLPFFLCVLSLSPPPLSLSFLHQKNNVMIIGLVGHLLSPQMKGATRTAQMSTGVHRCLHDRLCPRACSAHTCALDVGCTLKGKESSRPIERCNSAISNCTLQTDE